MPLIKCEDCKPHKYQDTKYGTNIRVANKCVAKGVNLGFRCTVCEKVTSKTLPE